MEMTINDQPRIAYHNFLPAPRDHREVKQKLFAGLGIFLVLGLFTALILKLGMEDGVYFPAMITGLFTFAGALIFVSELRNYFWGRSLQTLQKRHSVPWDQALFPCGITQSTPQSPLWRYAVNLFSVPFGVLLIALSVYMITHGDFEYGWIDNSLFTRLLVAGPFMFFVGGLMINSVKKAAQELYPFRFHPKVEVHYDRYPIPLGKEATLRVDPGKLDFEQGLRITLRYAEEGSVDKSVLEPLKAGGNELLNHLKARASYPIPVVQELYSETYQFSLEEIAEMGSEIKIPIQNRDRSFTPALNSREVRFWELEISSLDPYENPLETYRCFIPLYGSAK